VTDGQGQADMGLVISFSLFYGMGQNLSEFWFCKRMKWRVCFETAWEGARSWPHVHVDQRCVRWFVLSLVAPGDVQVGHSTVPAICVLCVNYLRKEGALSHSNRDQYVCVWWRKRDLFLG
jgi:hypothetical protein